MKRLLLLFILSSPLILFSQTTWQKLFDSGSDDNISINNPEREIINTSDGGFLFTGTTDVGVNSDILLIKTNNSFDIEWQMSYDAGDRDEAFAVVEKPSGGYYLAGRTSSFDGTANDALLIFVDVMGVLQWSKTYGNMPGSSETFTSIDIQSNGNLILAGYANELAGIGFNDNYLVVTDELGVEQWQRGFGGSAQDIGRQAIFDHDSEVLMFGGGVITGNAGLTDGYLNKFDVNGNLVWTKSYGGASADFAWGASIVKNNEGGYLLAGHTQSFGQGSQDFIAIKINSVGDTLWTRTYGGPGLEYLINAIATSDDGYLLFGYSDHFGPSTKNGIVLKIDSNGNLEWTKIYGDAAECHIMGAAESPSGYVFLSNTSGFNSVTNNIYVLKTDFNGYSGGCNESNVLLVTNNTNLSVSAPIGTYVNLSSEISRTFTETASNLSETVICFDDPTQDCFPSYVPTDSLVGWWPFCGNANDESGNGNNGVPVNGPTLINDRFGNPFSAYDFDGVDDLISVGNFGSNVFEEDFSVSMWCSFDNFNNDYLHLIYGENSYIVINGNGPAYSPNDSKISAYQGPLTPFVDRRIPYVQTSNDVLANQYYHFALVKKDTEAYIFLNGILTDTVAADNSLPIPIGNTLFIGTGFDNSMNYHMDGILDDIGIWNRALTQCEISELYHAQQFTPPVLTLSDTTSACGASTTLDAGTDPAWASYLWNTTEDTQTISVSNPGLYTVQVTDTNGCIGYDTTIVSLLQPTLSSITEVNCDTYTAPDGSIYTTTGNYTVVIPNAEGCDSTITINLTITNSNTGSETVTECDSYTWNTNGQTYTQSGQYTEVLTNQIGCDSTVTLNLTINSSSSSTQSDTGLDSYTWSVNNQTYTQSGTYTAVVPSASGCDSTITLDLTLQFTGLDENETSYVAVYPNPTFNTFTLSTKDMIHMNYTLLDNQGKLVLTGKIESTEETVDISKLSKGQYNLVFEDESISQISIIKN